MAEEKTEQISAERSTLLFAVRRSVRYHNRRRQFFDRLSKTITILTAVGGIGTVSTLLAKSETLALWYGAAAGFFSVLDLVIGCAEQARTHTDLAKQFIELEIKMVKAGEKISAEQLADFTTERLHIEINEPPILRVVDLQCHNELSRAMGYGKSEQYKISLLQKLFAPFFDFNPSKFEKLDCKG